MSITVSIPVALRLYAGENSEVTLDAFSIEEALLKLDQLFPGLTGFLLDERRSLRRYVNVFVNESDVRLGEGLRTKLKDGDRVHIVPAIAGG